ncbi:MULTISPECIES: superinfection immunity protein [unclassified Photorhabdus]|uniref:superinfection immunity protein n=1 Tax=unclassified Photorhabdus TaxID=2620880 RepID=UPI000DCC51DB|nr:MULTISPECIES: superinfection immunity protein [unclassified Photorhabdus]RAW93832.1 hypothetical protein CKY03_21570 [Photorhabdus sp. S9-53]RAW97233.1 hypothetical protein CKY04_21625 [Photorhabdus sp. S8-52]RAW97596.1 hypothetical protein CKY05_13350 [Photorhabdus sp. S10-54]
MDGFVNLALAITFLFIYFAPTYVASRRMHKHIYFVAFVNIIVGWTIIGWLGCMAWALTKQEIDSVITENEDSLRDCPYCAELVKKKAKICKHCQRDI